ncbi:MAG: leucine-rich repeat domain-containing protein [Alloprevotella sp.]
MQKVQFCFALSGNRFTFTTEFRRHWGGVWKKKVLLKLIIYKQYFMNKHLPNSLRALFLSLAVLLSLPVLAVDIEIDGINYNLLSKARQATVIAKSSGWYSGEVVIPESVEFNGISHSVMSIGDHAFYRCSGLTSVTIPNSVTSIGVGAFSGCYRLTSVTIPNSVTSIGSYAFYNCYGLTSFTIPNSVTSIGSGAFELCYGLTSVTIPNSVTSIGVGAFEGCSSLTSVAIPNSVTSIGSSAFSGCSGLTSVTIPNSVTIIWDYAFANCSELLDVYCYAEKVPSTQSDAFDGSYPEYATLHVLDASIDSYKATAPWSSFGKIVGLSGEEPEQPEVEKCATPVVTYAEGKLSFSCDTEGAEFVTNVVAEDAKKYYDAEIELSATYNIEVFATKANCENSDTVNVVLVWVENGDVNEDTGVISVQAAPVLVQGNGGVLSVSGVAKGTDVVVYTISGTEVTRSTATNGTATISTGLQSGTIVVVKFGNKSVKLKI